MAVNEKTTINVEDMLIKFEPLIRRIIREELTEVIKKEREIFYLTPNMPLYEDMEEILDRKSKGEIDLFTEEEDWSE